MKKIFSIISAGLLFVATSCNKSSDVQPASDQSSEMQQRPDGSRLGLTTSTVYYSNQLFNVNMLAATIIPNATVNLLYVIKAPAGTSGYLSVINKLPSGNLDRTVLWQQVVVSFLGDARPTQPHSEAEIAKMISAGLVSVEKTNNYLEMSITYALDSSK
jgi:hypothetical protein